MIRVTTSAALLALVALTPLTAQPRGSDPRATAMIDRGITRMGGEAALRAIKSIRLEVMTQWQRTTFGDHPYNDAPSYERNSDLRDYTTSSWRNSRVFVSALTTPPMIDVVRDSVGGRWLPASATAPARLTPLNIAYIDERRELFAFSSDRVLIKARDAGNAVALADTMINGVGHSRFAVTIDGYPATFFMRNSDGLPAMVRFRADETNDFGLAPWGVMEVEFWYSGWTKVAAGVTMARQLDVRRVGRPYKRMTFLAAIVNAAAPADSFAIPDSTVSSYLATQRLPMWNAPLDSAKIIENNFVSLPPFSGVSGAVRIGGKWVLLETGQAAGAAKLLADWISHATPGTTVGAGIAAIPSTSNGGVTWFADEHLPYWVAPGGTTMVRHILGAKRNLAPAAAVTTPRWVKVGTDSLWLEPIDVPNLAGVLVVYSPTLHWLYSPIVGAPIYQADLDAVMARLTAKGMPVEWLGSTRGIRVERK
ncbi:MAG: hypothetical protein ABIZ70_06300 [Gemmatimonadales bacterium]